MFVKGHETSPKASFAKYIEYFRSFSVSDMALQWSNWVQNQKFTKNSHIFHRVLNEENCPTQSISHLILVRNSRSSCVIGEFFVAEQPALLLVAHLLLIIVLDEPNRSIATLPDRLHRELLGRHFYFCFAKVVLDHSATENSPNCLKLLAVCSGPV